MSTELDMSQYLDLFLQEAEEQLEILEAETLKLEQHPTPERLQVIFRAAHTLKGSSRAMGFTNFAELTHEMENLLDQLRSEALSVTTEIADALLGCMDSLTAMRDLIAGGKGDAHDSAELVGKLQSLSAGGVSTTASTTTAGPIPPASMTGEAGFVSRLSKSDAELLQAASAEGVIGHARFKLAPDCVMKFARAFMAINLVQEHGEVLVCVPAREQLEEEQFDDSFELLFQSSDTFESIAERMSEISELAWYAVDVWNGQAGVEPESQTPSAQASSKQVGDSDTASTSMPEIATQPSPGARKADTGQTVRVDVSRLDMLMNLVGELVIDRTRIAQIGAELAAKHEDSNIDALAETVGHIARVTGDLQDQIMKARMMPIETVFNRFPRVVRDLAQKLDKQVRLEMVGGETELDRSVIEVIGDPLLHILRNSVDHGLELPAERSEAGKPIEGKILISARHQENHIVIEIEDDGKGIDVNRVKTKAIANGILTEESASKLSDRDALQLIFHSGLSTATVVSEVSGRGVGMDIVRSNLQKLGGIIDLDSSLGQGTKTSLRLPLTLAIIRGLLVRVAGVVYVIPLGSVIETLLIGRDEIQSVNQREVVVIRGSTTPLIHLRDVFQMDPGREEATDDNIYVVIVGIADRRIGLVVDSLVGEQEVVIKSLNRFCGDVAGVSGATILGDGNVALILDVNGVTFGAKAA